MLRVHRIAGREWRTDEGVAAVTAAAGALDRTPCWVEAIAPDEAEQAALIPLFGLEARSVEDSLEPDRAPVYREFDQHLFVIVHAPETHDGKKTRKVALFLGRRFLVTVVRAPLPLLDPLLQRLQRHPDFFLAAPERVAHAVLDHMADVFEERVDEMIDRTESFSDHLNAGPGKDLLPKLHALRRRASVFTRVVRAQRDVCQAFARGGNGIVSRTAEPYLRDGADPMLRVYDLLESVRDGILAARDSYLTAVSLELNVTMRTLTAVATILLPLSLLAGIFGMNFERMPLVRGPVGFWTVVGFMVLCAAVMLAWFRRKKWL